MPPSIDELFRAQHAHTVITPFPHVTNATVIPFSLYSAVCLYAACHHHAVNDSRSMLYTPDDESTGDVIALTADSAIDIRSEPLRHYRLMLTFRGHFAPFYA